VDGGIKKTKTTMKAATGGRAGGRVVTVGVLVTIVGLALTGCETTAEQSARLEREAHHVHLAERGLSITKASAAVHVVSAILVRGAAGAAAVVTLRNDSGHALEGVPIAITVKSANGSTLFQNNAPGLEAALTALAALPAHGEATWVDDQVPASGAPASVSAIAGEARTARGPLPRIEVEGVHASEENGASVSAAGTVKNRSNATQQNLVVYALARRAGKVVAAGRAILPEVAPGEAVPFQAFLTGTPTGATLQASAPATTQG
jgi:hypothetical protein